MTVFNFENIKSTDKEVSIAGKLYVLKFDDDSQRNHQKAVIKFKENYNKLNEQSNNYNFEVATEKDVDDINDTMINLVKDFIVGVLDINEYNRLYELAGRDTRKLIQVVIFLINIIEQAQNDAVKEAEEMYLVNNKK